MADLFASAGGFGGTYDAVPPDSWILAADAAPKLAAIVGLLLVLAAWAWLRLRLG